VAKPSPFGPLEGFGSDARQVLRSAEVEAERLHHPRIGTEHLLLGLLVDEGTPMAQALRNAGVSIAAARHKVEEAVGAPGTDPPAWGATPTTERANRAVGWAVRTSHQRRADAVTSQDLLQGVLHVEGTAGQVLRALRVDVDHLGALVGHMPPEPTAPVANGPAPVLRCPSCGEGLGDHLRHHLVTAEAAGGAAREALVFSCGRCGVVLGVGPA